MRRQLPLSFVLLVLFLALYATGGAAQSSSPAPQIFFTDLDSGPNSGGESVSGFSGAYVTLYGNFFGSSQGSSTVTWNGQSCLRVVGPTGSFGGWGSPHLWYQKIVVQLGAGCATGSGNFVVKVNGKASNGIPFTVRPGNIYCVSTSGNNNNSGRFPNQCWATIPQAKNAMAAGDVTYVENGVDQVNLDDFDSNLAIESNGSAGNPIALIVYPGASSTIGAVNATVSYGIRTPNIGGFHFWTIAGFSVRSANIGVEISGGSSNFRVIAMDVSCPNAEGFFQGGCMDTGLGATNVSYVGNYDHDNAKVNTTDGSATKGFHNMYFSTDSNHAVAAWNLIDGDTGQNLCGGGQCNACRGIQFHSSPQDATTGFDMYDLHVHDNLIRNIHCDAINFATVDPSKGTVEAYNNVIFHTGTGTLTPAGDISDYTCINFPGYYYQGPTPGGVAQVYNNTCYDFGSAGGSTAGGLEFVQNGTTTVNFTNNLLYALAGESYVSGASTTSAISGSNNLLFGSGVAPSYFTASVTANPRVVSAGTGDFHLLAGSPAINGGQAAASAAMDHDGVTRPQGSSYDIGAYEFFAGSTPPPPTLQSITATPSPAAVIVGGTVAFTATGHYSDGSTQDLTTQATWNSANPAVATIVSNTGVAIGVAAGGPDTITVSFSGVSGTASLTVTAPPTLQSIAVTPSAATVNVGSTVAFTATGSYSDGSSKNVTTQAGWTSSSVVATIVTNTGVATGVAAGGPATITASLSGIKGTASLTVTASPPAPTLQSITVSPSPASVAVGSTVGLTATGHYSDGSTKNITTQAAWTSNNSAVATIVSNTGFATGVAAGGPVTVTAAVSGVRGTSSLTVTSPASVVVVNFDTPAPSGSPCDSINGVFGGINFGTNQWAWESAYLSNPTNNIYFNSATGNTRTFTFASSSHVLISMKVATGVAGTLTLSDNTGQIKTQNISAGAMQLVATGWKKASSTITVTFTAGWEIEFDDITYQ
jgi:uncharacterized protein YjdB